jgi:hypothetical protein
MKKILVLVMVLGILLSGCDEDGNIKTVHSQNYDKISDVQEKNKETLNQLDLILDRLDTIDMNIDRIEAEREFSNQAIRETFDEYKLCYIDLVGDIFSDFSNTGTIDDVYSWRYDWHNDTIYYKNTENSEEKSITITEIVEEECY